jgi:hypothetical protein
MLVNHPRASDPDRLHDAVSGATVLVTGASFGIGAATARDALMVNAATAPAWT